MFYKFNICVAGIYTYLCIRIFWNGKEHVNKEIDADDGNEIKISTRKKRKKNENTILLRTGIFLD